MITNIAQGESGFTSNAFLVTGKRTVLVDTGSAFDAPSRIQEHDAELDAVVLTHTHPDHVGNLAAVKDVFGVHTWGADIEQSDVDHKINDREELQLGDHMYTALSTPGHKDDHLCFYSRAAGVLFAGDLVFANGGFGRTDLTGGDRELLIESIDRVLEAVDEDLEAMHTGHGPSVTDDPYRHIERAARMARTM